jgi:hypothetical protein
MVGATSLLNRLHPAQPALQDARKEMSSFPNNVVERPGGAKSTPELLRAELDVKADAMRAELGKIRQLLSQQGSIPPQRFAEQQSVLIETVQAKAGDVSELSKTLQEALRSHDAAGRLVEL